MTCVRRPATLRVCIAFTAVAVGLAATQALADAASGDGFKRSSLKFHERTSEGRLIGCELTFVTTGVDDYYRHPSGTVIVFGSYFFYPESVIADGLKICGMDVGDVGQEIGLFAMSYAYPIVSGTPLAKLESSSTVVDGCVISFYQSMLQPKFSDMKIAYSRKQEGRDVIVDFAWDSTSYGDVLQTQLQFAGCAQRALAAVK